MRGDSPVDPKTIHDYIYEKADSYVAPTHLRTRMRTLSQLSISSSSSKFIFDSLKASPASVVTVIPRDTDALGAFTTTTPASVSLLSLNTSLTYESTQSSVYGARSGRMKRHPPVWALDYDSQSSEPSSPIMPGSPLSISSIPSISRTSSSSSSSDILPASGTSRLQSMKSFATAEAGPSQMHPILKAMERKSKFCSNIVCSTCKKSGFDYPRCAKCGDMWCSRECRLYGGKKRHVCTKTT